MANKTLYRIDQLLARINTHPEYSLRTRHEVTNALLEEGARHSYSLELMAEQGLGEKNSPSQKKKDEKNIYRLINNGWEYLCEQGISVGTLAAFGQIIEPENHPYPNFRSTQVMFGEFAPPTPDRVIYKIKDLTDQLETFHGHPVLRAIEAHIEMIKIHPYQDGNGRSARLLQNFCLQERGYPAAIIPKNEREIYISLLRDTLRDRYNFKSSSQKASPAEQNFQEYIESKVLGSLERIEEELKKRRAYEVQFNGVESPAVLISAYKAIRSQGRKKASPITITEEKGNHKKKSKKITIIGDIGRDELESVLSRCKNNLNLDYTLLRKTE